MLDLFTCLSFSGHFKTGNYYKVTTELGEEYFGVCDKKGLFTVSITSSDQEGSLVTCILPITWIASIVDCGREVDRINSILNRDEHDRELRDDDDNPFSEHH